MSNSFQMKALSCVQSAIIPNLQTILNDHALSNNLTDALLRLKAKRVTVLLSTVLRLLLCQKHCSGRNFEALEIDHSDSLDVRKFYGLELSTLGKRDSNGVINELCSFIDDVDDFTRIRIQYALPDILSRNQNQILHSNASEMPDRNYFNQLFNVNREFGCTKFESCINQHALFKQHFIQIEQRARELNTALGNYPNINLKRYSCEINYVNELFGQLYNNIQKT